MERKIERSFTIYTHRRIQYTQHSHTHHTIATPTDTHTYKYVCI